jgi:mono/diheme cytochrome c family protein
MYTGILHTHKLVVVLFLLIYLVKTVLLLANQKDLLAKVKKYVRIPEMVISFLFLLSGLYLLTQKPNPISAFTWIKLVAVLAAIPLAVVGFKKENKVLAALSLLLIIAAYGLAEVAKRNVPKQEIAVAVANPADPAYDKVVHGKAIFTSYCAACHGQDGKLGLAGAKNLTISTLTDEKIVSIISNGKNAMSSYKKVLNAEEIAAVAAYVKVFRGR